MALVKKATTGAVIAAMLALLVPLVLSSMAEARSASSYVAVRGLYGWAQDVNRAPRAGGGGDISFTSTYGATVAVGRSFMNWLRVEGEFGYMYMGLDKMETTQRGKMNVSGNDTHLGLMINAYAQLVNNSPFTPFIGFGAGAVNAALDLKFTHPNTGETIKNSSSEWGLAYQLMVGVSWDINAQWAIELMYRYYVSFDRSPSNHATATVEDFELDGTRASIVMFGARFRF